MINSTIRSTTTLVVLSLAVVANATSCSPPASESNIKVSDVAHTPVKRQSIGNCWLYATATWAESMHLASTGETVNLSESYWTYWDWYNKILNEGGTEISTGGNWYDASTIIREHGYMLEGDFLPLEAELQMSEAQRSAETAINLALTSGSLMDVDNRSPEQIIAALDAAFKVNMATAQTLRHPATDLKTNTSSNGTILTLNDEIYYGRHSWKSLTYPQVYGKDGVATTYTTATRNYIMKAVLQAVNDRRPVIMSSQVEFAALNSEHNATFEYDLYIQKGRSSGQGGHLIVLEDYTVDNVPGIGAIGEGNVSDELKAAALTGTLKTLVVKNSWGTSRPERGLSDGYTRFAADYIDRPLPFGLAHDDTDIEHGTWYSAVSSFIVPPEY